MDADLIRLILLILGIALIAGIWLWDRWQRARGEPPMVRLREEDAVDEAEHDADPYDVDYDEPDDEPELPQPRFTPGPGRAGLDDDEFAPDDGQPVPEPEPEPEPPSLTREPAWVRPREPAIPAFLMRRDEEPEAEPADDAEPTPEPDAGPEPVARTQPALDADERPEPSLVMADDEPDIPVLELAPEPLHAPAKPARTKAKEPATKPRPEAEPVSIRMDEDQFDLDLGFSAMDDQDLADVAVDLPDLIVQINIVARGEPFSGEQVLAAMDQVEMRAGEHDIFHRYDNRAAKGQKPKSLFSLASLVEPGSFPLKKMKDFSTPGLTLFAQLPGPRDGLLVYSDMLYVAERLARLLDARLKDENRSTLTRQTIEHTRERIAEHKRQITLKLRQAGDTHRGRR